MSHLCLRHYLLQLTNLQRQKIYTITKDNYEETLPMLHLAPAAIADIQAAAQAGLTVTTHERRISINGYTGEGYIILNEWGDGAYMINGGLYGSVLIVRFFSKVLALIGLLLRVSTGLAGSLLRKINNTLGGVAGAIDKLLHCNKGINQAFAMLMSVFLATASFITVAFFAAQGVFLVTAGVFVIVTLLSASIMQGIDSACGYH